MKCFVSVKTHKGNFKQGNQDSALVKHIKVGEKNLIILSVCDGMGGLEQGELASATVIRELSDWFTSSIYKIIGVKDLRYLENEWKSMVNRLNGRIMSYGKENGIKLGTTFTTILIRDNEYMVGHVGDTRAYYSDGDKIVQITEDQTLVEREVRRGNLTKEEAEKDKRRNILLQCIGASKNVEPEFVSGKVEKGIYLICSDGFRHKIDEDYIRENINPKKIGNKEMLEKALGKAVEEVVKRNERDNITAAAIMVTR